MKNNKNIDNYKNLGRTQIYLYFVFTLIFFVAFVGSNIYIQNYENHSVFIIIFSLLLFAYLYMILYFLSGREIICGKPNTNVAFNSTIFPFTFIYLIGTVMLETFPGWIRGFANTFGITISNMSGLSDFINDKNLLNDKTTTNTKNILSQIYNDPLTLFNEITLDNYSVDKNNGNITWPQVDNLVNEKIINLGSDSNNTKKGLAKFIYIKQYVSYFIWYLLLGVITILVSINHLINNENCLNNSVDSNEFRKYLSKSFENAD